MTRNLIETLLGAIVLVVAIGFLTFAYRSSQVGDTSGYELVAKFNRVDGLERGADVRISGIKVGTVIDQKLDPETYRAEVRFTLHDGVKLPTDSSAAVVSNGLLGSKYLSLIPGGDTEMLKAGDEVTLTQSSINLEDLVGHMIFSQGSSGQGSGAKSSGGEGAAGQGAGGQSPGGEGADGLGAAGQGAAGQVPAGQGSGSQ
jgi:phospholipid/cholesterol/gamma-HCH transport system substrate-binding protein